ncbi:MAG: enhanced serine sensitivity protein SseB C-terminal domain-containing protein [Lachnospiraceae bacterium]|nr:enhanced serine sensitivity protein SseB C-terminal domain-containing protein [Lachnospiraceae bacterium]
MGLFSKFGKKENEEKEKKETPAGKPMESHMYTMVIQDIFTIKTAGCIVVGMVNDHTIHVGDQVYIISRGGKMTATRIEGMENPTQGKMQEATPGSNVGLLLAGIEASQVNKGDVISNVMAQQQIDVNKPVVNPRLKGLLGEMKRNQTEYILNLVFEEVAMQAHFLSIISFSEKPVSNGNGTATFQKGSTMSLHMLTTQDDKHFYPVFTDWSEIRKWQGCPSQETVIFTFDNYAEMILKDPDISGMVIDPFGANFVIDRKLAEHLKTKKDIMTKGVSEQKIEKETSVWLGEPKIYPTEMIEAVKGHLQNEPAVKTAWMRLMCREDQYSYLLVINFEGDKNKIFGEIANAARPYLDDMYIDMVPFASDFGHRAVEGVEPFYSQS